MWRMRPRRHRKDDAFRLPSQLSQRNSITIRIMDGSWLLNIFRWRTSIWMETLYMCPWWAVDQNWIIVDGLHRRSTGVSICFRFKVFRCFLMHFRFVFTINVKWKTKPLNNWKSPLLKLLNYLELYHMLLHEVVNETPRAAFWNVYTRTDLHNMSMAFCSISLNAQSKTHTPPGLSASCFGQCRPKHRTLNQINLN